MKRFFSLITFMLLALFAPVSLGVGTSPLSLLRVNVAAAEQQCVDLGVAITAGQTHICRDTANGGVIVAYVVLIIQFLGALIGAVVLLMMVIAGISYITSGGSPEQVKNAKKRLTNAITALLLFFFAYAILGFVVPGGIL